MTCTVENLELSSYTTNTKVWNPLWITCLHLKPLQAIVMHPGRWYFSCEKRFPCSQTGLTDVSLLSVYGHITSHRYCTNKNVHEGLTFSCVTVCSVTGMVPQQKRRSGTEENLSALVNKAYSESPNNSNDLEWDNDFVSSDTIETEQLLAKSVDKLQKTGNKLLVSQRWPLSQECSQWSKNLPIPFWESQVVDQYHICKNWHVKCIFNVHKLLWSVCIYCHGNQWMIQ